MTVFVPHYAMSEETLVALAADEIVMDEHAVLGPVDPQLGQMRRPLCEGGRRKTKNEIDDQTAIMADVAAKALRQTRAFVFSLLKDKDVGG